MTNHNALTHNSTAEPALSEIIGWFEAEGFTLAAAFEMTCDSCATAPIAA